MQDGRCITRRSALGAQHQKGAHENCTEGKKNISILVTFGCTTSPEMNLQHLLEGRPSLGMMSILHWSTEAAMRMPVDLVVAQLLSNVNSYDKETLASRPGLLFFDVRFSFCASSSDSLVAGATFERQFSRALQTFAAFPTTTVRILELQEVHSQAEIEKEISKKSSPHVTTLSKRIGKQDDPAWKAFIWVWPAAGLCVVLSFVVAFCVLRKARRFGVDHDSPRNWRDVAPAVDQCEAQSFPQGPEGGILAIVAHDFDPSSEDGSVFAATAGLEATECLTANKNHLVEVFARGEGWLYGRLSGNGLMGYLPEACVYWIGLNNAREATNQPEEISRQCLREVATPSKDVA
jgi:hypothetical protein